MQGQRAEHQCPQADAAERPTQKGQGLLFIEHGRLLDAKAAAAASPKMNLNAEADAKHKVNWGTPLWRSGFARKPAKRVFLKSGNKLAGA